MITDRIHNQKHGRPGSVLHIHRSRGQSVQELERDIRMGAGQRAAVQRLRYVSSPIPLKLNSPHSSPITSDNPSQVRHLQLGQEHIRVHQEPRPKPHGHNGR